MLTFLKNRSRSSQGHVLYIFVVLESLMLHAKFRFILNGKNKEVFFSETTKPRGFIFCVMQWQVDPFINPAYHALGVQIYHTLGPHYLP